MARHKHKYNRNKFVYLKFHAGDERLRQVRVPADLRKCVFCGETEQAIRREQRRLGRAFKPVVIEQNKQGVARDLEANWRAHVVLEPVKIEAVGAGGLAPDKPRPKAAAEKSNPLTIALQTAEDMTLEYGLNTYALVDTQGAVSNSHRNQACIAALNKTAPRPGRKFAYLLNTSLKKCMLESTEYDDWLSWFYKRSPFSHVLANSYLHFRRTGCTVIDLAKCSAPMAGIATVPPRYVIEHPGQIVQWRSFVERGIDPDLALVLSHLYHIALDDDERYILQAKLGNINHSCFYNYLGQAGLNNFLNHRSPQIPNRRGDTIFDYRPTMLAWNADIQGDWMEPRVDKPLRYKDIRVQSKIKHDNLGRTYDMSVAPFHTVPQQRAFVQDFLTANEVRYEA